MNYEDQDFWISNLSWGIIRIRLGDFLVAFAFTVYPKFFFHLLRANCVIYVEACLAVM